MKKSIHPNYQEILVTCACGNQFKTKSTKKELRLDICSACHPFYTGTQKLLDTAGRVERFKKRFEKTQVKAETAAVVKAAKAVRTPKVKEKKEN